jgi:hypothetical protein
MSSKIKKNLNIEKFTDKLSILIKKLIIRNALNTFLIINNEINLTIVDGGLKSSRHTLFSSCIKYIQKINQNDSCIIQ